MMWTALLACVSVVVTTASRSRGGFPLRSRLDAALASRSITNDPASFIQTTYNYVIVRAALRLYYVFHAELAPPRLEEERLDWRLRPGSHKMAPIPSVCWKHVRVGWTWKSLTYPEYGHLLSSSTGTTQRRLTRTPGSLAFRGPMGKCLAALRESWANQTRSYAAPPYLFLNSARPNLAVLPNALVTKIKFAPKHAPDKMLATSVSFIVAGGILARAGIDQLIDLPAVGENLQDHIGTGQVFELSPGHITGDTLRDNNTFAQQQIAVYKANEASILDEASMCVSYIPLSILFSDSSLDRLIAEATQYVKSSNASYKDTLVAQLAYFADGNVGQIELLASDSFSVGGIPVANKTYVTFFAVAEHLVSRGSVHITSSSPTTYPLIQRNYYSAPVDLIIVAVGAEFVRDKLATVPSYASYISQQVVPALGTNLKGWAPSVISTEYHPTGTASMLPREKGGVVNNHLVVYGTANVRVVDASIIPLQIATHPQSTMYGIAEYASDLMLRKVWSA